MTAKEKKVILFIVEGPSDESALGTGMKEIFKEWEVRFYVVHGDIATKGNVRQDTVLKRVDDCIRDVMERYRYKTNDIEQIIQIVDMDGTFIQPEKVVEEPVPEVLYFSDHVETAHRERMIQRNESKGRILFKLYKTSKVHGIPYRIYFMSCNLEHVLYGKLENLTDSQKWEYSDRFAERFEGKPEAFEQFMEAEEVAVQGSYQETWKFIERDVHSLERYSNLCLAFVGCEVNEETD